MNMSEHDAFANWAQAEMIARPELREKLMDALAIHMRFTIFRDRSKEGQS